MTEATLPETRLRQALVLLGVTQLFLGLFLALAPGTFYDVIATYGEENDHFLRDISTIYLAMGAALILAVGRPSWRAPVLFLVAVQYGLHSINHLIDIGDTDPGWIGPFNFVAIASLAAVAAYMLAAVSGRRR